MFLCDDIILKILDDTLDLKRTSKLEEGTFLECMKDFTQVISINNTLRKHFLSGEYLWILYNMYAYHSAFLGRKDIRCLKNSFLNNSPFKMLLERARFICRERNLVFVQTKINNSDMILFTTAFYKISNTK